MKINFENKKIELDDLVFVKFGFKKGSRVVVYYFVGTSTTVVRRDVEKNFLVPPVHSFRKIERHNVRDEVVSKKFKLLAKGAFTVSDSKKNKKPKSFLLGVYYH